MGCRWWNGFWTLEEFLEGNPRVGEEEQLEVILRALEMGLSGGEGQRERVRELIRRVRELEGLPT
ncbi:MAG: hypothetical protein ACUVXI_19600 [bacterium]